MTEAKLEAHLLIISHTIKFQDRNIFHAVIFQNCLKKKGREKQEKRGN